MSEVGINVPPTTTLKGPRFKVLSERPKKREIDVATP